MFYFPTDHPGTALASSNLLKERGYRASNNPSAEVAVRSTTREAVAMSAGARGGCSSCPVG